MNIRNSREHGTCYVLKASQKSKQSRKTLVIINTQYHFKIVPGLLPLRVPRKKAEYLNVTPNKRFLAHSVKDVCFDQAGGVPECSRGLLMSFPPSRPLTFWQKVLKNVSSLLRLKHTSMCCHRIFVSIRSIINAYIIQLKC